MKNAIIIILSMIINFQLNAGNTMEKYPEGQVFYRKVPFTINWKTYVEFNKKNVLVENYNLDKKPLFISRNELEIEIKQQKEKVIHIASDSLYQIIFSGNHYFLVINRTKLKLKKGENVKGELNQNRNKFLLFQDRRYIIDSLAISPNEVANFIDSSYRKMNVYNMAKEIEHTDFAVRYQEIRNKIMAKIPSKYLKNQ